MLISHAEYFPVGAYGRRPETRRLSPSQIACPPGDFGAWDEGSNRLAPAARPQRTKRCRTLMMSSGNGIIQNHPCSNRCMVIIPAALPLRRGTLRKCPNMAAVLLRRSTRLRPRCLRSTVSRPEASTRKRGNQRTGTPSGPTAVTAGRPMSTSVAVWASGSNRRPRSCVNTRRLWAASAAGSVATSDGPAALLGYPLWAIPLIAMFGAGGAIVAIRVFG